MVGKVEQSQPLTFTSRIGQGEIPCGKVQVMVTEPLRTPMIVLEDGRCFTLAWDDILQLANDAFLQDNRAT